MFMKLYNYCEDCEEFVKRDLFRTILKMVKPGKIIQIIMGDFLKIDERST